MKKSILLFYILSSMVISEECHTESDWCFNQAINFAFYNELKSINKKMINKNSRKVSNLKLIKQNFKIEKL